MPDGFDVMYMGDIESVWQLLLTFNLANLILLNAYTSERQLNSILYWLVVWNDGSWLLF